MGGDKGGGRQAVGGQGTAGIEAEPAEPEHRGAQDGHGQVVGMKGFMAVAFAFPDDERRGQGGNPGIDVDDGAAGEIQGPQVAEPAADPPDPVGHRVINQGRPEQGENQEGGEFHPFGKGAGDQGRGDDGKHQLKNHKGLVRNGGGIILERRRPDSRETEPVQAADDPVQGGAEGVAVAPEDPFHR